MSKKNNVGLAQLVERGPSKSEANSLQEFESPTSLHYTKELHLRVTKDTGYEYFIDYKHPLATGNSGRVYNHRHQASIKLGRWIKTDEHVHHKDSNKLNNSLDNLEVLSASEHASMHKDTNPRAELNCLICNTLFKQTSAIQKFCSTKCSSISQVKNKEITKELLDELIPTMSWVKLGKLFGYSDNGIKKRAKALGCKLK